MPDICLFSKQQKKERILLLMFLPKTTFCGWKKSDSRQLARQRKEGLTFGKAFEVLHLHSPSLSFFWDDCSRGGRTFLFVCFFLCASFFLCFLNTSPSISLFKKKKKASVGCEFLPEMAQSRSLPQHISSLQGIVGYKRKSEREVKEKFRRNTSE